MKTIFTLLTSLILGVAVLAADVKPKSMLTIKSSDRGSIKVVIDGRRFEPIGNYMRIQGITAGYHNVKIYRERNTGFFTIIGKRYEVVFSSSISIRPRSNVMISVDRFGRATVNESRMNGSYGRDDRGFGNQYDKGFGNSDDRGLGSADNSNWDNNQDFDFDRSRNQGDYDKARDGQWGNQGQDNHDGRLDNKDDRGYNDNGYNKAMSDFEFSRVLSSIEREWIESNKSKSASQIINTNYLTTAQVKQMLQLFSMENTKLDLAKQAYSKTVDQQNYFMINDVFSFNSSKDELARYIRSFR